MATGERRNPALDGVRGVAILLVLVGHAFDNQVAALAAAGVTLFFGLSGYLITGLLRDEYVRQGRVDVRRFYGRRMTRLAPPLFVMLAVVSAISWPGWGPVLSASTWTGNYTSQLGVRVDPFGHTWSLGVEEQFYLLWPLALGFLMRRGWALRGALVLTAVLVLWRIFLDTHGALIYAYGALETAGSAILVGAVVALSDRRLRGAWSLVGIAGLGLVSLVADLAGGTMWLVVPLLATPCVAVVLLAHETRWLSWRPLAFCGVASYSMYLWHEPVSYLLDDTLTVAGVCAGAAVGLAAYWVVEAPVMRLRRGRAAAAWNRPTSPGVSTAAGRRAA